MWNEKEAVLRWVVHDLTFMGTRNGMKIDSLCGICVKDGNTFVVKNGPSD